MVSGLEVVFITLEYLAVGRSVTKGDTLPLPDFEASAPKPFSEHPALHFLWPHLLLCSLGSMSSGHSRGCCPVRDGQREWLGPPRVDFEGHMLGREMEYSFHLMESGLVRTELSPFVPGDGGSGEGWLLQWL